MDKDALSRWIAEEHAKGISYRQLGAALGVSPTAVTDWRDRKFNSISEDSLRAIALRRKESIAQTADWLGIEAPASFDLPKKFSEIERRIVAMEQKVEYAYQRAVQQDDVSNSAVLDTYLLEHGINVRARRAQDQMRAHVAAIAGDSPGLFERLLLAIVGILPVEPADLPAMADLLKVWANQPWTPAEVMRVINEARVD